MPTLAELIAKLAKLYGIRWVPTPDPSGQLEHGYFERTLNGKTFGCPVSIRAGAVLHPQLIYLIYRRLDIADEPFEIN